MIYSWMSNSEAATIEKIPAGNAETEFDTTTALHFSPETLSQLGAQATQAWPDDGAS